MQIISAVIPVFIVVLCGYLLRRYGLLNEAFVETSNGLIYYVLLPALLFYKIGTSKFDLAFSPGLILGSYGATISIFFLSFLLGKLLKLPPGIKGTFVQGSFRGNLAYVGLPIVYNYAGDAALAKAGVLLGFMVPLLSFLAILALVLPHKDVRKEGRGKLVKEIVSNPLIIASFLGILWSYFNIKIPSVFDRTLHILSSATLPLALLCLGASFQFKLSRESYLAAAKSAFFKNLLLPFLALLIFRTIHLQGEDLLTGVIMMGAPTAVITYVFAFQLKGEPALASTIIVVSTLISSVTITFWIFFLNWMQWI